MVEPQFAPLPVPTPPSGLVSGQDSLGEIRFFSLTFIPLFLFSLLPTVEQVEVLPAGLKRDV